jgi:hypothetical protein
MSMLDKVIFRFAAIIPPKTALYCGLVFFCVFTWWANIFNIDIKVAWNGYSPIAYVYTSIDPVSFAKDFHSGIIDLLDYSAFMHIYKLAYKIGISPENLMPIIIGFQIAILAWAIFALCRTLLPNSSTFVPILVIVLSIASYARDMNFANFAQPPSSVSMSLYYNVADVLRIFAIVMILKGRPVISGALLAGSFATHATMGIMGGVFALVMLISKPREILRYKNIIAIVLFFVIACGWVFTMYDLEEVSSGGIPNHMWFDLSRLTSFHWYPVDMGYFTFNHQRHFIPFLSSMVLLLFYVSRRNPLSEVDRKIMAGMLAMIILVIAGVVISCLRPSTTLVKLALHRANDLIILIALVYVVGGLWSELGSGNLWRKIIALGVLISPFVLHPGFPLLYSILLVAPAWLAVFRGKRANTGDWIVTVLAGGSILLIIIYGTTGLVGKWTLDAYTGGQTLLKCVFLYAVILGALIIVVRKWPSQQSAKVIAMVAISILAVLWLIDHRMNKLDPKRVEMASNFKEVQLWARANTSKDALFMKDPTMPGSYGWRDYSRRSSFGVLHEWLLIGWVYSSKLNTYQEGLRRFNEFSINLDEYINTEDQKPPFVRWSELRKNVKERYYSFGDDWRQDLAQRYGIDYFIMTKKEMTKTSKLPVVFENKHFVVLGAGEKKKVAVKKNLL